MGSHTQDSSIFTMYRKSPRHKVAGIEAYAQKQLGKPRENPEDCMPMQVKHVGLCSYCAADRVASAFCVICASKVCHRHISDEANLAIGHLPLAICTICRAQLRGTPDHVDSSDSETDPDMPQLVDSSDPEMQDSSDPGMPSMVHVHTIHCTA